MKTTPYHSNQRDAKTERDLYTAVLTLRDQGECRAFFQDLCTPAEIQAMADRWAVVDYLDRGIPYREIHMATGVSLTTITRVARCLMGQSGGYRLALKRFKRMSPSSRRK